jgi:hypothetical protein
MPRFRVLNIVQSSKFHWGHLFAQRRWVQLARTTYLPFTWFNLKDLASNFYSMGSLFPRIGSEGQYAVAMRKLVCASRLSQWFCEQNDASWHYMGSSSEGKCNATGVIFYSWWTRNLVISQRWALLTDRDLYSMARNMKIFSKATSRDHDFIFVDPRGVRTAYTENTDAFNRQAGPNALHAGLHFNPMENSKMIQS